MVRVSIGVIKYHDQKQFVEERVYFSLLKCPNHNLSVGNSGQEFKAGTRGHGETLLTDLLLMAYLLLLTAPKTSAQG